MNLEFTLSKPICGIDDIEKIEKLLSEDMSTPKQKYQVEVVSWQRFEEEPEWTPPWNE